MAYSDLLMEIHNDSTLGFVEATSRLLAYINGLSRGEVSELLLDVGAIPQSITPSSSEEKLYSKATDIVLSRCFIELGLESEVLEKRGNSADVTATSVFHGYSLVADSKAMRLTRTAKNQKDFKVGALGDNWIGDNNTYAVLCCPLYQYLNKSQIYEQALNNKTCFFSWEHMKFLIDNDIRETDTFTLEPIWSSVVHLSRMPGINRQENFFANINEKICQRTGQTIENLQNTINTYFQYISQRAVSERDVILRDKIAEINRLSRKEAIAILVEREEKKTGTLDKLIGRLQRGEEE